MARFQPQSLCPTSRALFCSTTLGALPFKHNTTHRRHSQNPQVLSGTRSGARHSQNQLKFWNTFCSGRLEHVLERALLDLPRRFVQRRNLPCCQPEREQLDDLLRLPDSADSRNRERPLADAPRDGDLRHGHPALGSNLCAGGQGECDPPAQCSAAAGKEKSKQGRQKQARVRMAARGCGAEAAGGGPSA